jgi:hypothetical protein
VSGVAPLRSPPPPCSMRVNDVCSVYGLFPIGSLSLSSRGSAKELPTACKSRLPPPPPPHLPGRSRYSSHLCMLACTGVHTCMCVRVCAHVCARVVCTCLCGRGMCGRCSCGCSMCECAGASWSCPCMSTPLPLRTSTCLCSTAGAGRPQSAPSLLWCASGAPWGPTRTTNTHGCPWRNRCVCAAAVQPAAAAAAAAVAAFMAVAGAGCAFHGRQYLARPPSVCFMALGMGAKQGSPLLA